ncbi:MAG: RloB domain-containing protein, partial [Ruminococcus sp.]|nr:RloB domain-containing protein [Ruminococcus sp.]
SEKFENMDKYKKKENFERCLSKLTLDDVREAVRRAQKIMEHNAENYSEVKYKRFRYYRENPALEIGTIIGNILNDCGLI